MKWIIPLFALVLVTVLSCNKITGVGPMVTETVQTGQFNGLNLEIPAKLYFTVLPVNEQKVEIKASRNILDVIKTDIHQGDLRFRFKNNVNVSGNENIEVFIHAPEVLRLKIAGSGEIKVLNNYMPSALLVRINGSGAVTINTLESRLVNAEINGSGSLNIQDGAINTGGVDITGSGLVEMRQVIADSVACKIQGSGNIRLHATDFLHVTISGSGEVRYKGNPIVETSISGSGKVSRL